MQAVVYQGPGEISVEDVDEPALQGPDEAIVTVEQAGLCGSDLHVYHGEVGGVLEGDTMGHELVGTVEAVGGGVTSVQEGDRVVASFQSPCGSCRACARQRYNGCEDLYVFGYGIAFGGIPGAQAERVRVPRADLTLRKLPDGVTPEEAVFAGDVLTAAYTGVRPHLRPGDTVAVVGAGPVGLLAMETARTLGAARVFGIDLEPRRVDVVEERGHTGLDPAETDPIARVMAATEDQGADLVIEAVGGEGQALETAFSLVGPGGHVSSLGVPTAYEFEYPWLEGFTKGFSFQATLANVPRWIDEVLELQAAGRLETSWMVSHRMGLDEAVEAYEMFGEREALKIILEP